MSDLDGNNAVLRAFLVEARERLAAVERKFDALQSRPGNTVLWNAICRDFHAVTRGAVFFDVPALLELCQSVETLFDVLRDGELPLSADLRELTITANRAVLAMIEVVAIDQQPAVVPNLVTQLRRAVADTTADRVWQ